MTSRKRRRRQARPTPPPPGAAAETAAVEPSEGTPALPDLHGAVGEAPEPVVQPAPSEPVPYSEAVDEDAAPEQGALERHLDLEPDAALEPVDAPDPHAAVDRDADLERQADFEGHAAVDRDADLERQADFEGHAAVDRDADLERDVALEPNAALEADAPLERDGVLERDADPQPDADLEPDAAAGPDADLDHDADRAAPVPPASGWRTLARMGRPRLTKANLLAAVLTLGLGFALVAQVKQTQSAALESLPEDELVRILDDFTQDNLRLGAEISELESTRDSLISGAGSSSEALAAAEARADTLAILAGTRPARGPGIQMSITDPDGEIKAPLLLDMVEELRDAGAEALQINGIRVVASSYFTDVDGGIELSGKTLVRPYQVLAIGDSATMASAMKIPGGVVDTVRGKDGIVVVEEKPQVDITALHAVKAPQYAQPVPSPSPS